MRLALCAISCAVMLSVLGLPREMWAEGILDGLSGNVQTDYSFVTTKNTDSSGNTTKTEINNYISTSSLFLNYDLYPKLNLNAGMTYQKNIADPVDQNLAPKTEVTKILPFAWLTLRDPIYNAAAGYSLNEQTVKISGGSKTTLTQDNYNANFDWRPEGFPATKLWYTRTNTHDDQQSILNTVQDNLNLKSEYIYQGLDVYYLGTYLNTQDKIRNFESTQWSNEGRLVYATTFFNGRTSLTTDNRVNVTNIDTKAAGQGQVSFPIFPVAAGAASSDTPQTGALPMDPTSALIDGNLTSSAGVNIGLPPLGGDTKSRNMGLDFLTSVELNSLLVWVDRELPQDIANSYSWDIYTSTDNLNWTFYKTVLPAPFGPFLNRFEINFPNVKTRYIKVVTKPLSPAVIIPPTFQDPDKIFVTELQASLNTSAQAVKGNITRTFQNYNLDVKTRIFDSPSLYYDFNGYYYQLDPNGQSRYNISNGLFFNHIFNPIFSTSANASVEFGTEADQHRMAFLYYASVLATPLRTLSNSLVFSGNNQNAGGLTNRSNSVVLYNTAQLYKGIDLTLNLGWVFSTQEQELGGSVRRTDVYVNPGINIVPNPNVNLSLYYLGKKSHVSGSNEGQPSDTTENRLDLGASWNPISTLFLSASANIVFQTNQKTSVQQSYGLNWTPFPDGQLQFSFYFNQNYYPDSSRIIQPTLRWYLTSRRRSYVDVSYQLNNFTSGGQKTETNTISTTLKIYF